MGAWRLGGVSDTPSLKWYKKGLGRDFEIGIVGTWFSGVKLGGMGVGKQVVEKRCSSS